VNKSLYEKKYFDQIYCEALYFTKHMFCHICYVLGNCESVHIVRKLSYMTPKSTILAEQECNISCCSCNTCWHLCCAQLTKRTAESLSSWTCFNCLTDACGMNCDNFDEVDTNSKKSIDHQKSIK
jgi:hypothetical protein